MNVIFVFKCKLILKRNSSDIKQKQYLFIKIPICLNEEEEMHTFLKITMNVQALS